MQSTLTANKNFLSPNGFKVSIDANNFQNLEYFCVEATLPSVSLEAIQIAKGAVRTYHPGERVDYGIFSMKFMVDENMMNYMEIYQWLVDNATDGVTENADIILHIQNSKNNTVKQVRYLNAFPITVDEIRFMTQNTDVQPVQCGASFRYDKFEFIR